MKIFVIFRRGILFFICLPLSMAAILISLNIQAVASDIIEIKDDSGDTIFSYNPNELNHFSNYKKQLVKDYDGSLIEKYIEVPNSHIIEVKVYINKDSKSIDCKIECSPGSGFHIYFIEKYPHLRESEWRPVPYGKDRFLVKLYYSLCQKEAPTLLVLSKSNKGKWGWWGGDGSWKIKPIYDDARDFDVPFGKTFWEGIARVKFENKWGFINTKGEQIIEPKFEYVWDFRFEKAKVRLEDGTIKYINKNGSFIDP